MKTSFLSASLLMIGLLLAGGCASPWEKNFEPNAELAMTKMPPASSVEIRTIPFERYQRYVDSERKRRIESSTAPQDLGVQQRLADKNRLLETLQLRERGDEIDVIGWSEFSSDEKLSPQDPKLIQFAKRIGADLVVVASTYAGQVSRVEDRAVTTYSNGFTTFARGRGRRANSISYTDQSTTWVPVRVLEDQFFYEAVFLRRHNPQQ